MPFLGVNALVVSLHAVFDQSAVESGDSAGGEAAVRADGKEHEGDAVFRKTTECGIRATACKCFQVKTYPHVNNADVGIGVKSFGKLGALVEHVALGAQGRGKPREQSLAVRGTSLACAFFQPSF